MFNLTHYRPEESSETLNNIKENLSYCALKTIVSHAGGSCSRAQRDADSFGIDASCIFRGKFLESPKFRKVEFSVQLKSTSHELQTCEHHGKECWKFPISAEQLEKYKEDSVTTLIFVLFILPPYETFETWVEISQDRINLQKCAYWTSLNKQDARSVVYIPQDNILTANTLLNQIVVPIAEGKEI